VELLASNAKPPIILRLRDRAALACPFGQVFRPEKSRITGDCYLELSETTVLRVHGG
jgi:hypothetical protein